MTAAMEPASSGMPAAPSLQSPQVKICGLTSVRDAAAVSEAGADYAGFVFHPKSKRNITYDRAREIMDALDPAVRRVAVCVSPSAQTVKEIQTLPFDFIQIHGSLTMQALGEIRLPLWRAVNLSDMEDLADQAKEPGTEQICGILVDAKEYGSGKTFDWTAAGKIRTAVRSLCEAAERKQGGCRKVRFILAGGLSSGNISEGIRLFSPDVVDVSSGVEYEGGLTGKDPEKVKAFMRAVRGSM